jgi:hypothetical protein
VEGWGVGRVYADRDLGLRAMMFVVKILCRCCLSTYHTSMYIPFTERCRSDITRHHNQRQQ